MSPPRFCQERLRVTLDGFSVSLEQPQEGAGEVVTVGFTSTGWNPGAVTWSGPEPKRLHLATVANCSQDRGAPESVTSTPLIVPPSAAATAKLKELPGHCGCGSGHPPHDASSARTTMIGSANRNGNVLHMLISLKTVQGIDGR